MANFLVFVGLGPPIGFVSLLAGIVLLDGAPSIETLGDLMILGLPLSYGVGAGPAAVAWGAVRYVQNRRVGHEGPWVAGIGGVIGVTMVCLGTVISGDNVADITGRMLALHGMAGHVSALACWQIGRRVAGRTKVGSP